MTGAVVLKRMFDARLRGVRWVEIIGVVCVAVMVLSVYVAKAAAARESAVIGEMEREIDASRQRVRLLRAEISRLEEPARLEALSRAAGLAPVEAERQATAAELPALKAVAGPVAPPVPQPDAVAESAVGAPDPGGAL